jgi:hypothetical protein
LRAVQKVYDLSPPVVSWVRRKLGVRDHVRPSITPKD